MSPSKDEVEKAKADCKTWTALPHPDKTAHILAAALRASEARNAELQIYFDAECELRRQWEERAELLERQRVETLDFLNRPDGPDSIGFRHMLERHASEREALK